MKNVLNAYFSTVFKTVIKTCWIHVSGLFSKQSRKMDWIAKPFVLPLRILFITKNNTLFQKTRTKLAASERHWRLRSSPIVENKTVVSLCKFKSVLIYTWIAKPFILPLQIFATITNKITFSQNSNENRRYWAELAAPDFANSGKKTCGFLM